jgi:hypothetical protein
MSPPSRKARTRPTDTTHFWVDLPDPRTYPSSHIPFHPSRPSCELVHLTRPATPNRRPFPIAGVKESLALTWGVAARPRLWPVAASFSTMHLLSRKLPPAVRARKPQARLLLEALGCRLAPAVVGVDAAANVHVHNRDRRRGRGRKPFQAATTVPGPFPRP